MSFGTSGRSFALSYKMPKNTVGLSKEERRVLKIYRMMNADPVMAKEINRRQCLAASRTVSKYKKAKVSLAKVEWATIDA
jgi:hypothetical protein